MQSALIPFPSLLYLSGLKGGPQVALGVKNLLANTRDVKRHGFDPWVGKILWTRKWQSTPVFLSGESHGQRSLAGYRPLGHKESGMTEVTEQAPTE